MKSGPPQSSVVMSLLAARRSAMRWASAVSPRSNALKAMASVTGLGGGLRLRRITAVETMPTTTATLTAKISSRRKGSASKSPHRRPQRLPATPPPRGAAVSGGDASDEFGQFLAME